MSENSPVKLSLQDPLGDVTRQERKMLLRVSIVGVLIAKAGLVPSKISTLGIELNATHQQYFQVILASVVVYFLFAFVLYGFSDFLSWRIAYNDASKVNYQNFFDAAMRGSKADAEKYYPIEWVSVWPRKLAFPVSMLRASFEFLVPVALGIYAAFLLITGPA